MDFINHADKESEKNDNLRKEFSVKTGIEFSGYFFSTKQSAPRLKINSKTSIDLLAKNMEELNKHLLPIESYIQYEIYDSSMNNIKNDNPHHYILMIGSDIKIINEYNNETISEFKTLLDALEWVQKNANYEEEGK